MNLKQKIALGALQKKRDRGILTQEAYELEVAKLTGGPALGGPDKETEPELPKAKAKAAPKNQKKVVTPTPEPEETNPQRTDTDPERLAKTTPENPEN